MTKEYIASKGYKVEELAPRIFRIDNFMKKHEREEMIQIAENATDEDWQEHYRQGLVGLAKLKYGRDDLDNLIAEGLIEVTQNWSDKTLPIHNYDFAKALNQRMADLFSGFPDLNANGVGTLQRQPTGIPLKEHIDNHADPSLAYAAVIYVNDEYTDGEIFFTKQEIALKPVAGSLMLFPCGEDYPHGVNPPGEGPIRYVIPTFISKKNFYNRDGR